MDMIRREPLPLNEIPILCLTIIAPQAKETSRVRKPVAKDHRKIKEGEEILPENNLEATAFVPYNFTILRQVVLAMRTQLGKPL